jgi:putative NADH-flavin reductase
MKLFLLLLLSLCCLTTTALSPIAVIGSTGRLGREAVQKLSERGIPCKMLVRKLPLIGTATPSSLTKESTKDEVINYLASLRGVSVVEGDVGNVDSLKKLLTDCTACLALFGATRRSKLSDMWTNPADEDPTHAKQVNYKGVTNLLEAAKASKTCKRVVRITGKGETPSSFFSVLINMLGSMAKAWNYEGERLLRAEQDVDYTIIRPGIMSEEGPEGKVLTLGDNGADLPVAKIAYADIATLSIECLDYPNAARSTLTAMTTTEGGEDSYAPLLATVQADRRVFPTDMLEQHHAAVKKALVGLGTVTIILFTVVVKILLGFF